MGGGPPCFTPGFTCPVLLWCHLCFFRFRLQDLYLLRFVFPNVFSYPNQSLVMVRNPTPKCGLGSSPFARRYSGNRCFFLFLRLLRCFSSPGSLDYTMDSCSRDAALPAPGFPIRTSVDQGSLTAPHSFSQLTTSFFGSWCQGIRPAPYIA